MEDAANATVLQLIEILAGRDPISRAPEVLALNVVSHMDGFTFAGLDTWAAWLSFIRARSRVGSPDLETGRLVANADGTVTAYGRWIGQQNGERVLSPEVWARYRVVDGKIVEIWTTRTNYVFLLGPNVATPVGLVVIMLKVFLWGRSSNSPKLST